MIHNPMTITTRTFIRLASLAVLAALLFAAPQTARSAIGINRYVSPAGSNSTVCTNSASPCKTISYALIQAAAGDTLLLDPGVYTEHLTIDKSIRIVKNPAKTCPYLVFDGTFFTIVPCPTIDGSLTGRVISITAYSAVVNLEKITIRKGTVTDASGAGILNNGELTLDNVIVHTNTIELTDPYNPSNYVFRGGGIDNQHNLTVRNSSVHNNSAYDGGGIASTGVLTVSGSEIYTNTALRYGGGIIVPYGSPSTIENSTLRENSTGSIGGGIYIGTDSVPGNMGSPHAFRNVTISGNSCTSGTGGLFSQLQVNIDHSTLADNSGFVNAGKDLSLSENQFSNGYPHSRIADTIVSNPGASFPLCSITGAATFGLSAGRNISSDASCDFTLPNDQSNTNPGLLPLAANGGPVQTHALPAGSPAIDAAGPFFNVTDARGVAPQDGNLDGVITPDIGAYEFEPLAIYIPLVWK